MAFVTDPAEADVVVVNTCSFIEDARKESIEAILEAAALKRSGSVHRVVVAGCLLQRYSEELRRELPEVDAFVGLDQLEAIVPAVAPPSDLPIPRHLPSPRSTFLYGAATPRRLATAPWTAYVKIAEGCDHTPADTSWAQSPFLEGSPHGAGLLSAEGPFDDWSCRRGRGLREGRRHIGERAPRRTHGCLRRIHGRRP